MRRVLFLLFRSKKLDRTSPPVDVRCRTSAAAAPVRERHAGRLNGLAAHKAISVPPWRRPKASTLRPRGALRDRQSSDLWPFDDLRGYAGGRRGGAALAFAYRRYRHTGTCRTRSWACGVRRRGKWPPGKRRRCRPGRRRITRSSIYPTLPILWCAPRPESSRGQTARTGRRRYGFERDDSLTAQAFRVHG
jgi:hypothetical protein